MHLSSCSQSSRSIIRVNHSAVSAYLFTQFFGIHHQQHQHQQEQLQEQEQQQLQEQEQQQKEDRQHLH